MGTWRLAYASWLLISLAVAQGAGARDDYNFAAGLHDRGLHERSAKAFQAYLKKWPEDQRRGKARFFLGESLLELNRDEAALPHFLSSAKAATHLRSKEAALRSGELLHRSGKSKEALPWLVRATEGDGRPEVKEAATYWAGEAALAAGDRGLAAEAFKLLIKSFKNSAYADYAQSALGFLEFEDGKFNQSRKRFQLAAASKDREVAAEAQVMIGECSLKLKQYARAISAFEGALAAGPGSMQESANLGLVRGYALSGQHSEAIGAYKNLSKLFPACTEGHATLIRAAAACHQAGDDEKGLVLLNAIQGARGQEAKDLAYWRGLLNARSGNVEDAIAQLRAAVKAKPSPRRKFGLADALSKKGEFEEAAALYRTVRKEAGDDLLVKHEAAFAEAFALNRLKKFSAAAKLLSSLASEASDPALVRDAKFARAENLFALDQHGAAIEVYAELLRSGDLQAQREAACLYKAAWCHYRLKQPDDALQLLVHLSEQHPTCSFAKDALYLQGKCHEVAGREDSARSAFAKLGRMSEGSELGIKALLGSAASARRSGQWEAALRSYEQAAKVAKAGPLKITALMGVGDAASALGRAERAAKAYGAVTESPDVADAYSPWIGKAWALRELKQLDAARTAASQAKSGAKTREARAEASYLIALIASEQELWPSIVTELDNFEPRFKGHARRGEAALLLGMACARTGDHKQALPYLQLARKSLKQDAPTAQYELAFVFEALKRNEERDAALKQLVTQFKQSPFVPDALFRLGESAYASGAWPEALAQYRALAAREDGGEYRDKALYKSGWCFKRMKQPAKSAEQFALVAQLEKSELSAESCFLEAEQWQASKAWTKAADAFARMLKQHDDHELADEAAPRRILCLAKIEQWDQVIRGATSALSRAKHAALKIQVQSALGDAFFARKDFERARRAWQDVISNSDGPLSARAQYFTGKSLQRQGKADDALDALLKVTILYTQDPWVRRAGLSAAKILDESGQAKKALRLYRELVASHPDSLEAKVATQRINDLSQAQKKEGKAP